MRKFLVSLEYPAAFTWHPRRASSFPTMTTPLWQKLVVVTYAIVCMAIAMWFSDRFLLLDRQKMQIEACFEHSQTILDRLKVCADSCRQN